MRGSAFVLFCAGEVQAHLSDGALADLCGHRLELWICGQIEFVVPQQLKETTRHYRSLHKLRLYEYNSIIYIYIVLYYEFSGL